MTKVTIAGNEHELSIDSFGVKLIDGLNVDDYLDQCSHEEFMFLAQKGISVASNEPEQLEDIIERTEMPDEQANFMRQFNNNEEE